MMATTRLDNETLRAELQKTQDALEAALRECQDKDCKYSQLLTTLQCHKVDHSRVVESLVKDGDEEDEEDGDEEDEEDQDEDGDEEDEEAD